MPFVFEQPNLDNADESHLYFDPGDGRLITVFTKEDRVADPRRTPTDPGCVHHVAFAISQAMFAQAVERLDERGIRHSGVKDRGFMDSIYFTDPLGLLIELAAYRFEPPQGTTHADVLFEAHRIRVERGDRAIAPLDADAVRLEQHVGVGGALRGLKAVGGELNQQPERVGEVDRVHEPAVLDAAVADATLVEALDGLGEHRLRQREREVVDAARVGRRPGRVDRAVLLGEDRDQAAVAGVEVEVRLVGVVEVRLLEHERHPEHALPEVDRRLPVGADDRDVVDSLALELLHRRCTRCDLYSLRCSVPHGTSSTRVWTTSTSRILSRIASASAASPARPSASSTATGSGGSCFTPCACGFTRTWPLTSGANAPMTSRTADGKTLTPRTISMSSVRPMQRITGPVRPQGQSPRRVTRTWSRVRKRTSGAARWRRCVSTSSPLAPSSSGTGSAVCGSISSACTKPRAPRCMPFCSSHSPQSETPMSPMPIASVTFAPQPSSNLVRKAGSPPPGSPATSTRRTLDSARRGSRSARYAAYDGVSTTASGRSSSIACNRRSVLPVPTGMCVRPMRSNEASAAPATNGPALYVETMRCPGSMPDAA